MMGQLPAERVTLGSVFDKVGVDYVGLVYTKIGAVATLTHYRQDLHNSICITEHQSHSS